MQSLQYNLDMTDASEWKILSAEPFSKENFLYLQEAGHFISGKQYYTRREGLESYLLKLTLSGSGILEYGGETYRVQPGSFFLIDCTKPQTYYTDPETGHWNVIWAHFDGITAKAYYEAFLTANHGSAVALAENGEGRILEQLLSLAKGFLSGFSRDIAISALLTQLLAGAVSSGGKTKETAVPDFIRKAADYLQQHYNETVSLEQLSRLTNVSKFHLQREFTAVMHVSPAEYVRNLRMIHAKELLRGTERSVSDIAQVVGMDAAHFVQVFRKKEGATPGQYRRQWKNNDSNDAMHR